MPYIGVVLGLYLLSIISAQSLICLRQGETIHFSECNPNMEDYVCDSTKCQLCISEVSSNIYCSADPSSCNEIVGGCTYLYPEPLPTPANLPLISLVNPVDKYSVDSENPLRIEFSFKATKSSEIEKCELVVNGDSIYQKSPISLTTQRIFYTISPGNYIWKIKCTQKASDGGNIIFSDSRELTIKDASMSENTNNTQNAIILTSPENNYEYTGQQDIIFGFNISGNLTEITQCSLNLNNQLTGITEIETSNAITQSVPVGVYAWKVECTKKTGTISSESRNFTVIAPAAPASSGGSSGGGGGGGGGGAPVYTLTQTQLDDGATKDMTKGAKLNFKIANQTHYLTLNEITGSSAKMTVSSTPQTFSLNIGEEKKVDVNADNVYDLSVKLEKIISNKAQVTIKAISQVILGKTSSPTESENEIENTESTVQNQSSISGITGNVVGFAKSNKIPVAFGFVIIVAIIGLISYNLMKKKNTNKKE